MLLLLLQIVLVALDVEGQRHTRTHTCSRTPRTPCTYARTQPPTLARTHALTHPRAHAQDDCDFCPTGKFCLPGYPPRNCPEGYWCEEGNNVSGTYTIRGALQDWTGGACPPGKFSDEWVGRGSNGDADCRRCPPGGYCPGGLHANWPLPCPAGTYGPHGPAYTGEFGLWSPENCTACPAGKACPFPGRSRADTPCFAGYYCEEGTVFPNQNPCPAGTYSDSTDADSVDDCMSCPEFKACLEGTGSERGPPEQECVVCIIAQRQHL